MDMTRHLKRWLTDKALAELGGEFEGVIADVSEELIRNRFTAKRSAEVVVTFDDGGFRLVLNKTVLTKFIAWFGPESNDWIGRRVRVFRRRVEMPNQKGELRSRWQRDVVCEDHLARAPIRRPVAVQPPAGDEQVSGTWGGDTYEGDDADESSTIVSPPDADAIFGGHELSAREERRRE
jgi:hypothetical protein